MEENKYTFEVTPKATKPEIKAAIEDLFQVKVVKVNATTTQNRVGKFVGYKLIQASHCDLAPGDEIRLTVLFPEV